MSNSVYAIIISLALFLMIIVTRALPFFFSRILQNNETLRTIGGYLPAYIMLLLVIYEVGIKKFTHYPFAIPAIVALSLLTVVHWWKRQMLLSILVGTSVYLLVAYLMRAVATT